MSVPESRVRKSNRQHVPNPIYQQGITQLKNQNTTRIKRKNGKNNDESNMSFEEERSQMAYEQSVNISDGGARDQYMACKMPNGQNMRVKFVIDNRKEEKEKEKKKEKEVVNPPPVKQAAQQSATVKKPPTTNLLNLFIQAIDNVDVVEQPSSEINQVSRPVPLPVQKQKPILIKPKRSRIQQQNYLKKVTIQDGKMKFLHSQHQNLQYLIDWQETHMVAEQTPQMQQLKKKLQNCKQLLKNISIFS